METLKHYLVYKITNKVDGKFYIGKHETYNVDDGYFGSGKLLKRAQDRYGLESFEKQILADFDDPYSMNSMEEILVDAEFVKRKDTYNLTVGGDGGWFHCKGENHNNLHNNRRTGFLHILDIGRNSRQEWEKTLDENEVKKVHENISKGLKRYYKNSGSHWKNKKHKEESIEKMRQTHAKTGHQRGKKNSQYGKHWWTNPVTLESKSLYDSEVPCNWVRGRRVSSLLH